MFFVFLVRTTIFLFVFFIHVFSSPFPFIKCWLKRYCNDSIFPPSIINRCAINKNQTKSKANQKNKRSINCILHIRLAKRTILAFYLIYLMLCLCAFVINSLRVWLLFCCYRLAPSVCFFAKQLEKKNHTLCPCVNNSMSNSKFSWILCEEPLSYRQTLNARCVASTHPTSIGILNRMGICDLNEFNWISPQIQN